MSNRSDPVLTWLRGLLKQRGLNTAELARRTEMPKPRLRKILAGQEAMLVEELMLISTALELTPADMGLPGGDTLPETLPDPTEPLEDEEDEARLDPYGNHVEQLFRAGFALGCDFMFVSAVDALEGSGVPESVLAHHRGRNELPIRLDAAYHQYNQPRYTEEGVTVTLSFDGLYECSFPWSAIDRVIFYPEPWDAGGDDVSDAETPSPGPHLRLVE
jgi:transcriptional regulator with XRE-family HTH domain